jgi:crotonobetainyl-CoA:carnitine CoA-transferase CaiB-like acyl-CoA transferase
LYGALVTLQCRRLTTELYEGAELIPPSLSSGSLSACLRASDGSWITFGILEAKGWPAICRALDREDLLVDPRFAAVADRSANERSLVAILSETILSKPSEEWVERLRKGKVPCSVVNDFTMIAHDPQAIANGYVIRYEHPLFGSVHGAGVPSHYSRTPPVVTRPAPVHPGEDTEQILEEAGVPATEITELLSAGVVHAGSSAQKGAIHG